MAHDTDGLPTAAYLGGTEALTVTPIVGRPSSPRPSMYVPGS